MKILEISDSISQGVAREIETIFFEAFGTKTDSDFLARVNEKHKLLVTLAYMDDSLIGFKLGYEKHRGTFFTWLGAVSPKHQRMGIARALLHQQHASCKSAGYEEIQTHTSGANSDMLILNLQEGFTIFGAHLGRNDEMTVQLRKQL